MTLSMPRLAALGAAAYASFGTLLQVFPPFLDELQREFDVGRTLASLSMTAFLAPVALTSILVGAAVDRRGCAPIGRLGFALLILGSALAAAAPSFSLLLAARAVAGLGGGMLLVATLQFLAATVPPGRLGTAFGVYIIGLPIGTGIAFDLLNHLASWRQSSVVGVAIAALAGMWFTAVVPRGVGLRAPGSLRADVEDVLGRRPLRQLALLVFLGFTAIVAFTTWAPTRLATYASLGSGTAALIASVLLIIDIPFGPLWGRVSDRIGRRKPFVVTAFLVYAAGAALVPGVALAGVLPLLSVVALMGIGCAMFFPATLAIPQALVPASLLGTTYGLFLTAQAAGMAVGPLALGLVFERAAVPAGIFLVAGIAAAGLVASSRLQAR